MSDSERFYDSTLEILEDPEEQQEVQALMKWWNMWVLYNSIYVKFQASEHDSVDQ